MLFSTERLLLCQWSETDAPFILELLNTDGWLRYIGNRNITNVADAEHYIRTVLVKGFEDNRFGFWCVIEKQSEKAIGMVGYVQRDWLPGTDLGFALLPDFEGKGYAFEAAKLLVDQRSHFGFDELLAVTMKDNERSISLLKRLGFEVTGTVKVPDEDEELNLFVLEESH